MPTVTDVVTSAFSTAAEEGVAYFAQMTNHDERDSAVERVVSQIKGLHLANSHIGRIDGTKIAEMQTAIFTWEVNDDYFTCDIWEDKNHETHHKVTHSDFVTDFMQKRGDQSDEDTGAPEQPDSAGMLLVGA